MPFGGRVVHVKILLAILMLALATLAVPSTTAALEAAAPCTTNPSNDTACHAEAAGCEIDTYSYDVEDALNRYSVVCGGCGYDTWASPELRTDCYSTPPLAGAAAAPCQAGVGRDTHCEGKVSGCGYMVHSYWSNDALNRYKADCGCVHYDNYGRPALRFDCIDPPPTPLAASASGPASPCTAGFAQTWCDATVGPCDVRVTPWTAWGDVYAWADCRGGSMTRCYAEVHTQDPLNPDQWCAF